MTLSDVCVQGKVRGFDTGSLNKLHRANGTGLYGPMTGSASEPGIHNHHREYGFRACAKRRILKCAIAHRGMTTENKNAPVSRGVSYQQISAEDEPRYAAAFSAEPSTACGATALAVVIGMLRGFLASGISRTRST